MKFIPRLATPLFLALIAWACGQSPEQPFVSEDGVQLMCPAGWSITENAKNETSGYHLQLEKDGFDSSGIVIFNWTCEVHELEVFFGGATETFVSVAQKQFLGLAFELELGEAHEGSFGGHSALKVEYTGTFLGVDHQGALYALHSAGKTFFIMKQEANEDHAENMPGFSLLESSFVCTE